MLTGCVINHATIYLIIFKIHERLNIFCRSIEIFLTAVFNFKLNSKEFIGTTHYVIF
jgi:hypothetical protein